MTAYYASRETSWIMVVLGPIMIVILVALLGMKCLSLFGSEWGKSHLWAPITLTFVWGVLALFLAMTLKSNYFDRIEETKPIVVEGTGVEKVVEGEAFPQLLFGPCNRPNFVTELVNLSVGIASRRQVNLLFMMGSPIALRGWGMNQFRLFIQNLQEVFWKCWYKGACTGSHDAAESSDKGLDLAKIYELQKFKYLASGWIYDDKNGILICYYPDWEHVDQSGLGNDRSAWEARLMNKLEQIPKDQRSKPKILLTANPIGLSESFKQQFCLIISSHTGIPWVRRWQHELGQTTHINLVSVSSAWAINGWVLWPGRMPLFWVNGRLCYIRPSITRFMLMP